MNLKKKKFGTFFFKKNWHSEKPWKNRMPGFEKVLQTLVKVTLKKAKTNEVKTLKFYLEST